MLGAVNNSSPYTNPYIDKVKAGQSQPANADGKEKENEHDIPKTEQSERRVVNSDGDEYIRGGGKPEKENKPEKPGGEEEERCIANTDSVDREIKQLKEKIQQLEQQMNSVRDDPEKRREIEKQLSQITSELSQKDTDAYRKANTTFTSA